MSCDLCTNGNDYTSSWWIGQDNDGKRCLFVETEWSEYLDGYAARSYEINYCPMCGRKLEGNENK